MINDALSQPTSEEIAVLESNVPSRSVTVLFIKPTIKLFIANHPYFDGMDKIKVFIGVVF